MISFLIAAALLALPGGVSSQSPLPEAVSPEPYPFSDRYPAVVLVDDPADWRVLSSLEIEMEGLRAADGGVLGAEFEPVIVTVYVNPEEAEKLQAAGLQAVPIPNQGLRARLLDRAGIFTPSSWPTFEQMEIRLQTIAAAYPQIVSLVSIGKSVQERDLWCLKISDNPDLEEDEPEVKYSSSIHGDETTGMEMVLRLAEYLTGNYAADTAAQTMVNEMEIWLCPLHNPDGYVNNTRYNANGKDLNREFPELRDGEVNSSASLEPENAAFWNLENAHSFGMGANYHGGAQVANYPWDAYWGSGSDLCIESPDDSLYYAYSIGYAERNSNLLAGGFTDGVTLGCDWYEITGGMQDWAYNYYSEHHITLEISTTKAPPFSSMDTYWEHNREAMLWWLQRSLTGARGLVTDAASGLPLPATISLQGASGLPVHTDAQVGDYHRLLLPGTYTLQAAADCYLPQTAEVSVGSATATVQNFALLPDPQCLPHVDLAVSKSDGLDTVYAGQVVTYTIMLASLGPEDVSGVALRDDLPTELHSASWSCAASAGSACSVDSGSGSPDLLVDLLNGGAATLTVTAQLADTASATVENSVQVAPPEGFYDPQPGNNQAADQTTLLWRLIYMPLVLH